MPTCKLIHNTESRPHQPKNDKAGSPLHCIHEDNVNEDNDIYREFIYGCFCIPVTVCDDFTLFSEFYFSIQTPSRLSDPR